MITLTPHDKGQVKGKIFLDGYQIDHRQVKKALLEKGFSPDQEYWVDVNYDAPRYETVIDISLGLNTQTGEMVHLKTLSQIHFYPMSDHEVRSYLTSLGWDLSEIHYWAVSMPIGE